jgi:(p)ppGpp synthase/HD superfamily hydrolase
MGSGTECLDIECAALEVVARAFAGKVDKAGQPYIGHLLRVGMGGATARQRALGFLHDVFEDTPLSPNDLFAAGFDWDFIGTLSVLTRFEGEDYETYIERVVKDREAWPVKLLDLRDNLDGLRLAAEQAQPSTKDLERYERYWKAFHRIERDGARKP